MNLDHKKLETAITNMDGIEKFSGTILVTHKNERVLNLVYGYANRSDKVPNTPDTRFGMASGCKIFTAVAISKLVQEGKISFDTPLKDCTKVAFPNFDPDVTVHHLLTHTSGIPDYFDEDIMDDFGALWQDRPTYSIKSPRDFLPLFQNGKMKFSPGEKFHYNNGGFIVLGIIVEDQSGMSFTDYVRQSILEPCGMIESGYFAMNVLPERTALGYIEDKETGTWRTNIFDVPIIGGPDGGAFTTAPDMIRFWNALKANELLDERTTNKLLSSHVHVNDALHYGYGIWMVQGDISKYFVMGWDPGVDMRSSLYPDHDLQITVLANGEFGGYQVTETIEQVVFGE